MYNMMDLQSADSRGTPGSSKYGERYTVASRGTVVALGGKKMLFPFKWLHGSCLM